MQISLRLFGRKCGAQSAPKNDKKMGEKGSKKGGKVARKSLKLRRRLSAAVHLGTCLIDSSQSGKSWPKRQKLAKVA